MAQDTIRIRGARQHNLKNINLEIPRNKFVVITGVSGSGKSSLAFDTLFAEGQRRYLEALSTYARQLIGRLNAPLVEEIDGLSPAIAIEQKGLPHNPRSTVGTLTEIHDYLRLLFARLGTAYCPNCNLPVRSWTLPQILEDLFAVLPDASRMLILAPQGNIGEKDLPNIIKRLLRDGFARIRANGTVFELAPAPAIPRRPVHSIEIVVDRLILQSDKKRRLTDSLELALRLGRGTAGVAVPGGADLTYSQSAHCAQCGYTAPELTPSLFSFHHPAGACPVCKGLGTAEEEREQDGAPSSDEGEETLPRFGSAPLPCPACGGTRLDIAARSVRLGSRSIDEISRMNPEGVTAWLGGLELDPAQKQIAERPVREAESRLRNLVELGLPYLTLDRAASTLSGGEAQRVRLAHQISSTLSGVLYVLDEPSIGLHPRDHERLLRILLRLREAGNSLIVVEHDRETILQSDYVVDMGPGAGAQGGEVVFSGPPEALAKSEDSLTGLYLSGKREIPVPKHRKKSSQMLQVLGASGHNLKNIDAAFPLGCMTCVTGVSGSGKSTLVLDTLYRALAREIYRVEAHPAAHSAIKNGGGLRKVVLVDQSALGRTPRSTPATYTGVFGLIRQLFARVPEARARGYSPARFSFNARGGRCEHCKGEGCQRIEMYFLPDIYVTCPICEGSRYGRETLDISYRGHSIADVLGMTVFEAASFFANFRAIRQKLDTLIDVGMGYIRLGQPATTLSGGEAQRVKLASELSKRSQGHALYILDEPTTGLHFEDIGKLLHVLRRLVDQENTVIIIEHHPDVIKTADYIIDLGPEGGEEGGRIVASGTPEEVALSKASHTAVFLRRELGTGTASIDRS
ncbi:MAG: excinuclease ABC subunit UvrA [Desulfobacteraceae bacterium]|nr:excinuclease ABC subunit UvrA [Desulfobacteraceae bacterium]